MTEHTEAQLVEEVAREVFPDVVTDGRRALVGNVIKTAIPLIQQQVLRDMCERFPDKGLLRAAWISEIRAYASENGIDLTQGEGQ